MTALLYERPQDIQTTHLRGIKGEVWGLTEGVTEGVPQGVDGDDDVGLSSLKSPLGILNFCTEKGGKDAVHQTAAQPNVSTNLFGHKQATIASRKLQLKPRSNRFKMQDVFIAISNKYNGMLTPAVFF